jgi:flagellar basal body-associated protein FliL
MSDEKEKSEAGGEKKSDSAPKKSIDLGSILVLLNTVALLGVLGLAVYTKILYKRPKITEEASRAALEKEQAHQAILSGANKVLVKFDQIEANLKPSQIGAAVEGGPPVQLKPHFVTMVMSLEILDPSFEPKMKEVTPKFTDQLLQAMGQTTVDELASVQGRFILRSKISGMMNDLLRTSKNDPPIVTNVYFSEFVVQ